MFAPNAKSLTLSRKEDSLLKTTNESTKPNSARTGSSEATVNLVIDVVSLMVDMNSRIRPSFMSSIKPSHASNTIKVATVPMDRDANTSIKRLFSQIFSSFLAKHRTEMNHTHMKLYMKSIDFAALIVTSILFFQSFQADLVLMCLERLPHLRHKVAFEYYCFFFKEGSD